MNVTNIINIIIIDILFNNVFIMFICFMESHRLFWIGFHLLMKYEFKMHGRYFIVILGMQIKHCHHFFYLSIKKKYKCSYQYVRLNHDMRIDTLVFSK